MFTSTLVPQRAIAAEEGTLWPSPRVRRDHPLKKAVPNTQSSSRGATRHDNSPESSHVRHSAAADGNRYKGRPLSGDGDDAGRSFVGDNGDGGDGPRPDTNNTTSRVRSAAARNSAAEVPGNLLGPNEHNRPQDNSDNGIPDGDANMRRHGQRPPSAVTTAAAVHRASKSDRRPGLDEAAGVQEGKGGKNNISWGAPARELVERTAARSTTAATTTTDDADFRNNNWPRPGRGQSDGHPHPRRDGAQKEETAGGRGHSTAVYGENNDDDRFARGCPGDRYYLPPPPRNSRPRTSPDETSTATTPRQSDKRRSNLHQQPSEPGDSERRQNRSMSGRGGGGGGGDNTHPPWSSAQPQRRESRRSSSSDRLYGHQPDDHRPMLGASEASGASHMPEWRYGWRGSPSNAASFTLSQEEESLPYYVDRKQVCVCV